MISITKEEIVEELKQNISVSERLEYIEKLYNKARKEVNGLKESYFRDKLADNLENAETEVEVIGGFIDVLTDDEVIEVKRLSRYKSAIGQVQVYSLYLEGREKIIHLIDDLSNINKYEIDSICNDLGIKVTYEKDPVLEQVYSNINNIENKQEGFII